MELPKITAGKKDEEIRLNRLIKETTSSLKFSASKQLPHWNFG
jgi:hypothetical protein